MKKFTVLLVVYLFFFLNQISAQIIHIPSELSTIQAGIDSAANGDTVLVSEGTYFENINFNGKAITVASQFIMDGDTSHISKTVINGSQSTKPDTASVVTMWSGEDTTSVLMGFTVKGGTGTIINNIDAGSNTYTAGGGVLLLHSGGKIVHNIIMGNHLSDPGNKTRGALGCGITAGVNHLHTAIIRSNEIRNNYSTDGQDWGGGICLIGGRMLVENNFISGNTLNGKGDVGGAGIIYENGSFEGTIEEVIIRNNSIIGNKVYHVNNDGGGGGLTISFAWDSYDKIRIYNNVIAENFAEGSGGGMSTWGKFLLYNNTIVNNEATVKGNSIFIGFSVNIPMYNNIIWSNVDNSISEIGINESSDNSLRAYHNILEEHFMPGERVTEYYNKYQEPFFVQDSYAPADTSPAIGWGKDSIEIDGTWYYAPASDLFGNKRPDLIDQYVDAGAIESAFPKTPNANLKYIGLWNRKLLPDFHKDTLHYVLPLPDTTVLTPQLNVATEDWAAEVDINNADSIGSLDPADRTTTITVTAYDGTTKKTYSVLFRYASTDASLSKLSISKGMLVPEFQSDSLIYTVCLPRNEIKTPSITCKTTDLYASVQILYAKDIQTTYQPFRTTFITVTAEDGIHEEVYEIEHLIDKTIPKLTVVNETVLLNDSIEVTSTEDGHVYLVPENTPHDPDSIMVCPKGSTVVEAGVPSYIEALDTGTFWLYVIDSCLNISSTAVEVTIIVDGIHETIAASIRLFPNPVNQILYIETSEAISSVELFNIVGVKVMGKSNINEQIDMRNLEQGIYFIRINTDKGEVYTGKVIKR